jgi:hypothetical protein
MNPNKVKELLNVLVDELKLPICVSDRGPIVIIGPSDSSTRSRAEDVVKHWMDGEILSHAISVGRTVAERDKATTRLALDTHRSSEVKAILESLIVEQSLPLNVVDSGFKLEILTDEGIDYRSENMMKLEDLLEKEGLDVPVHHHGFHLLHKEDAVELLFSEVDTLANHLSSLLVEHGLHVRLLHTGFRLHKKQDDEIDIAEAKELTYRLETMVGIHYAQGGYSYSNDVQNPKIHWTIANITTAIR